MAKAKKKRSRKGKRKMSPAQRAALKKMQAARKASLKGGGKKRRRKGKRRAPKRVRRAKRRTGPKGFRAHPLGDGTGAHYHAGSTAYARGIAAFKPKRRKAKRRRKAACAPSSPKRRTKHRASKKHQGVVSAATILRNAKSRGMKVWSCAGIRRTGCGGGKKGGHVVGHLR